MRKPKRTMDLALAGVLAFLAAALLPSIGYTGPLKVVATVEDLAAITRAVGADEVEVFSLCRGYQDPHYVAAKPSLGRKMRDADLLVYVGLQLEIGWLPLLIDAARNPDLRASQVGNLQAAQGIDILEVPAGEVDRAAGDVHPEGNPHYWLDPHNGKRIARTIADRLIELRPERRDLFESNLAAFTAELDERIEGWKERLAPFAGRLVVPYHKQWEYLLTWADLRVLDYIEHRPGIPPSPRHVQQLIERARAEEVSLVLYADFIDKHDPEGVADRAGVPSIALPASVGSRPEIRSYFDLFEVIVGVLERTMSRE